MDINLTGQIWVMPINLMVSISEPPWWLPLINLANWLPLLVVVIGAYFTYHYAHRLDNEKNRYDLKIKVYFELLDSMSSLKMYKTGLDSLEKEQSNEERNRKIEECSGKIKNASLLLFQLVAKMQVVSNRDMMDKFFELLKCININESKFDIRIFSDKQIKLTNVIRKDLGPKLLIA